MKTAIKIIAVLNGIVGLFLAVMCVSLVVGYFYVADTNPDFKKASPDIAFLASLAFLMACLGLAATHALWKLKRRATTLVVVFTLCLILLKCGEFLQQPTMPGDREQLEQEIDQARSELGLQEYSSEEQKERTLAWMSNRMSGLELGVYLGIAGAQIAFFLRRDVRKLMTN